MATVLYLVRHGKTEGDGTRRYKGTLDVPLSGYGLRQAEAAARFIKQALGVSGRAMSAVYCSGLQRAARSAEAIAGVFSLRPVVVPDLRERDFGRWEGMSFEEIMEQYPDEFGAWAMDPLRFSPLGGESTIEVKDRAMKALRGLLERHGGEAFCVVAHGGVNRVALCDFMGMPLENIFRLEQDFACVNVVEFHDRTPVVRLLNWSPVGALSEGD